MIIFSPDEYEHNRDWMRTSGDDLPDTREELLGLLAFSGMTVEEFKETAVYRSAILRHPYLAFIDVLEGMP
jgi:hypothetical protein